MHCVRDCPLRWTRLLRTRRHLHDDAPPIEFVVREMRAQEKAFQRRLQQQQTPTANRSEAPPPKRFAESTTHRIKMQMDAAPTRLKFKESQSERAEHSARPPPSLVTNIATDTITDLLGNTKMAATTHAQSTHEERGHDESDNHAHDTRWPRLRYAIGILGVALSFIGGYVAVEWSGWEEGAGRSTIGQRLQQVIEYARTMIRMVREPSRDKLLPDVARPPLYQPPYTLVLEFTDVLVHPEWTYRTGWRLQKRPGVDAFLEALCTRFEVVVYTAQLGAYVLPAVDKMDAGQRVAYTLGRDATHFIRGHHVKDLDRLNRDLNKVVAIDWCADSLQLHTRNLFQIARWKGDVHDRTLLDLAAFLIAISEWEVEDVRTVLDYYAQFDDPLAKFKENQMQALRATQLSEGAANG